jgi:hypothetical protein
MNLLPLRAYFFEWQMFRLCHRILGELLSNRLTTFHNYCRIFSTAFFGQRNFKFDKVSTAFDKDSAVCDSHTTKFEKYWIFLKGFKLNLKRKNVYEL